MDYIYTYRDGIIASTALKNSSRICISPIRCIASISFWKLTGEYKYLALVFFQTQFNELNTHSHNSFYALLVANVLEIHKVPEKWEVFLTASLCRCHYTLFNWQHSCSVKRKPINKVARTGDDSSARIRGISPHVWAYGGTFPHLVPVICMYFPVSAAYNEGLISYHIRAHLRCAYSQTTSKTYARDKYIPVCHSPAARNFFWSADILPANRIASKFYTLWLQNARQDTRCGLQIFYLFPVFIVNISWGMKKSLFNIFIFVYIKPIPGFRIRNI